MTRSRSAVFAFALAALVLAPAPQPAAAFELANVEVWRTDVLRWHNASHKAAWARATRRAAKAWNRGHIGIRLAETKRRKRALVTIAPVAGPCQGDAGLAPTEYAARRPVVASVVVRTGCRGRLRDVVIAHELGHVLGLQHESRVCSAMRPAAALGPCDRQLRRRLVMPDDIRGARRMYQRPPPLRDVRFEHVPCQKESCDQGQVRVSWETPNSPRIRWVGLRTGTGRNGHCVERFNDAYFGRGPDAESVAAHPGKRQSALWPEGLIGRRCLTVGAVGPRAQMAKRVERFRYSVLPRVSVERTDDQWDFDPDVAYVYGDAPASVEYTAEVLNNTQAEFYRRGEARFKFEWDFGDPASGADNRRGAADPDIDRASHTYRNPGTYTIGVLVTDLSTGVSVTQSRVLDVQRVG